MTLKLIASALTGAFCALAAVGLAQSEKPQAAQTTPATPQSDSTKPDTLNRATPPILYRDAPKLQAQKPTEGDLVCDNNSGKTLCYPKDVAPDKNRDTSCYGNDTRTFCYSTPKKKGIELEI